MTTTTASIPNFAQFLADPEAAAMRTASAEPAEELLLADAEEAELAELWASDSGNQGA